MFKYLATHFIPRINNRGFPVDDPAKPLYKHLDWTKSVIGGSYALKQFTGDNGWEPNDIDILTAHNSKDEFDQYCNDVESNSKLNFVKSTQRDGNDRVVSFDKTGNKIEDKHIDEFGDHEMFHDLIKESKTYNWNNYKVQMVYIKPQEGRSLQSVLAETTDSPSCVSFHIERYHPKTICGIDSSQLVEEKIFHVPSKGLQLLMTGQGISSDICKSRKRKYEDRGYKYN